MKELLRKYKKSIIWFLIIGIVVIPILIHIAFKIKSPIDFFVAVWDAGDFLAFYGALVGSIATVWGVYLSIEYSRSNYQEDVKKRVLPFVVLTNLRSKPKISFFSGANTKKVPFSSEYEEYKIQKIYYIIKDGNITAQTWLSAEQQEKIEQGGFLWRTDESGTKSVLRVDLVSIPLELENVGNGVAIQFRVGLNSNVIDEEKWQHINPMPLKVGQSLYVHIYCDDGEKSKGSYILDLVYDDIYGNKYRQCHTISIDCVNGVLKTCFYLDDEQKSIEVS